MKTYKLIRIYEAPAENRADAWKLFRSAEQEDNLGSFLCSEFVKEKEDTSLVGEIKKQVMG